MNAFEEILIVGAGPTGLSAALFLARLGHKARVVEQRMERSPYSKAFGVNARSLDLLDETGVTERFLANGRKLKNLNILRHGRRLARFSFSNVDHAYPFLCVQSQSDSERILEDALKENGIVVERGVKALGVEIDADEAVVRLERDGMVEEVRSRVLLAADGASSTIRKSLQMPFEGTSYDEPWKLYDLELDTSLDAEEGHIFLLDDGGMFVVRHQANVWRVLGSGKDLLGALPEGSTVGRIIWESDFAISNRVSARFSQGPVFLAGDAAHIHSGIGARGMNLGIEDAWVLAALVDRNELARYDAMRRPVVNKVVDQIRRAMLVPRAGTLPGRLVRTFPYLLEFAAPTLSSRIEPWVLGLDHDINIA